MTGVGSRGAVRRDSAVHVSLSSDSPVKQRGNPTAPLPVRRRAAKAKCRRSLWLPIETGAKSPHIGEELRRHAVAPRRRRAELAGYIGVGLRKSQHLPLPKLQLETRPLMPAGHTDLPK